MASPTLILLNLSSNAICIQEDTTTHTHLNTQKIHGYGF
ncbi:hypothetical protein SAMN05216474_2743 [Lishizhenia tianjinensis]|uniref:Uncharacterized protein n=1 Tax=Lishizhenia tianjinensis TaxID=477690 RepID=A0A1I7BER7_9FLAO|nr:hypothetical protein SAMN05216474_2743 [Lishizhenia tianjinensis]